MAENQTQSAESTRGRPKTRIGIVTSNKMSKTVVVTVRRRTSHAAYGKVMSRREKYKAHVEDHEPKKPTINEGDKVLIAETKRASKDKRWRVVKVLEKATTA